MGFWRFDDNVSPVAFLNNPDSRVIHPSQFLAAHARMDCFTPQVLMPYLPGPEYSVDMVVEVKARSRPLSGGVKKVCFSIWKMKGKRLNLPSTAPA